MSRPRLAILDDHEGIVARAPGTVRLRELADVTVFPEHLGDDQLVEALGGFHALLAIRERTRFHAGVIGRLNDLELLLQTGGHAYHVDVDAATRQGVLIALGRRVQAPTRAVPELVFGLIIALLRDIPQLTYRMRSGQWPVAVGRSLHGLTLGILGLGRHGVPVARLAQAFGMRVVAWGPTLTPERAERAGASFLDLDELLRTADIVTIHLRLSDQSRELIDRRRLALMKPGACLINTARGAIVEEEALVEALTSGRLAGAALDVFAAEPLSLDSRLRKLENVVLTPHIGWKVGAVFEEFASIAAEQLEAYLHGRLPMSEALNPDALAAPRSRIGGAVPD